MSVGTTSLPPSAPQNDCMKLNRFSPTRSATRSARCSSGGGGSAVASSTATPNFAGPTGGSGSSPASGRGKLAEGRAGPSAPRNAKGRLAAAWK
uniref:Uncharacterized protein n=1 Tax=Arundo donax TaxID=35708 RepID=A0A0A9GG45_ARUDO